MEQKDSDQPAQEKEGVEELLAEVEEMKNSDHPVQGKETDQLQISEKNLEEKEVTVPTEYYAINLMNLLASKK